MPKRFIEECGANRDRTTVGLAVTAVTKGVEVKSPNHSMMPLPDSQTRKVIWRSQTLPPDRGTPGMGVNLWGESPLYEDEGLMEGSR
ncbi:MAG: hypothetical protein WBF93_01415 [Pirellulales bacterium]